MSYISDNKVKENAFNKQRFSSLFMDPKEKIRKYIDFKELTVYSFEKKAGINHGVMGKGKDFGVSLLSKIKRNITDLNMNWLIYEEGDMLLEEGKQEGNRNDNTTAGEMLELQRKLIKTQEELIDCQRELGKLKG